MLDRIKYWMQNANPVRIVAFGYLSYIIIGACLLVFPFARKVDVSFLDNFFIAVSAVSTTGLVTISIFDSYTFFGQLVILVLIQIGGLGYMTFSSFVLISRKREIPCEVINISKTVFSIPKNFVIDKFIVSVVMFTFITEIIGAVFLYFVFLDAGITNPLWNAIFHSVSAFCTAGFSLFNNSFEGLHDNVWLNVVISILSLLGAIGFIVYVDVWRCVTGRIKHVTMTTKIILTVTSWIILLGTLLIFVSDFSLESMGYRRVLHSFFQTMTAVTTVGFNTIPISSLAKSSFLLIIVMMVIGASPAGTGGGIKTTSISAFWGLMKSVLRKDNDIFFWGAKIPFDRVKTGVASIGFYLSVLLFGTFLLTLTERGGLTELFFEASSALGTVGLSLGITDDLSELGKLIISALMYFGRLGPLTIGLVLFVKPKIIFDNNETDLVV